MTDSPLDFLKSGNLEELFVESRNFQVPAIHKSKKCQIWEPLTTCHNRKHIDEKLAISNAMHDIHLVTNTNGFAHL